MLTGIRTSNGLTSTRLADIQNKGYFTCDNNGLYQISVSLMTYTVPSRIDVYKNSRLVNYIYLRSGNGATTRQTTFVLLEHLSKGDTIILKAGTKIGVYGDGYSIISVLQITT